MGMGALRIGHLLEYLSLFHILFLLIVSSVIQLQNTELKHFRHSNTKSNIIANCKCITQIVFTLAFAEVN